ncbi:hypothetical protein RhiirA1_466734 [Rhizophagus irregularis]|uniref:Uncharacterized protein n=1 Tax=Rhizophagus irregularis TaxID=588596 RepID=A0A2I1E7B3_9GLOM|nr:hypothetical protein RhiirA1_466734 [Rhizophagus irregularis]PKY18022.1 hypothetical protein RhiirB3_430743 [Rhizophagus irregularis]
MDNEQQPTNRTINATQMECTPCDYSDTTSNNLSSYASLTIRRRRNQRRLRHEITINNMFEIVKIRIWKDSNISNIVGKPTHFRS